MLQITVLDWAAKSPDLNIIEYVWAMMARELAEEGHLRNLRAEELWGRVQVKWEELRRRPQFFQRLAASMPRRLQAVMDAGGAATKY